MHHAVYVFSSCVCEMVIGIMHHIMHHASIIFKFAFGGLVKGVGTRFSSNAQFWVVTGLTGLGY